MVPDKPNSLHCTHIFQLMNRRITLIAGVLVLLACATYFFFRNSDRIHSDPLDAIPNDAAMVLECKSGADGIKTLRSVKFWNLLQTDSSFSRIEGQMRMIDSISKIQPELGTMWTNEMLYLSVHQVKANAFDYLYVMSIPETIRKGRAISLLEDLKGTKYTLDEREYENVDIYEFRSGESTAFAFALAHGLVLASKTSFLVEDAIRQLQHGNSIRKSKAFIQAKKNLNASVSVRCYLNHTGSGNLISGFFNPGFSAFQQSISNLAQWQALNLSVKDNSLDLTGRVASLDTSDAVQIFRKQSPVLSHLPEILPSRTAFYLRWGSSTLQDCLSKLRNNPTYFISAVERNERIQEFNKKYKTNSEEDMYSWIGNEMALAITEPGTTEFENSVFAVVKSNRADEALTKLYALQNHLGAKINLPKYKNHPIGSLPGGDFISLFFGKSFQRLNNPYFTLISGYVIFSNQITALKSIIDEIDAGKTLIHAGSFLQSNPVLHQPSFLDVYMNVSTGTNLIKAFLNPEIIKQIPEHRSSLNALSSFFFSVGKDEDNLSSRITISFLKDPKREVNLLFATQLDTTATQKPAFIETADESFAVALQDDANKLYFIDDKGNILWQKQLGEKILSEIQTVDYYHNGTKELLFNTSSQLFMIDQEGNTVAKFPIRLPATATNGCSIVYNSSLRSQQILVACSNGQVYAYDLSGKPVSSWLFEPFLNGVTNDIKPVLMGKQTVYLVTSTAGKILLADARGRTREVASGLSETQINSLEILPADSGSNTQFMVYDSSGVYLYTLEGNRGSIFGDLKNIQMIKGVQGWPGSNTSVYIILTSDSLLLFSKPDKQECLKSLPLLKTCHLESDFDQLSRTWTGLIYPSENTFFLLADDCSIPGGFPVKGNSKFCVRKAKGDGKYKLLIASTDGNLYVYNLN